ncbi:MAG: response regulator transcription factor [candidate division Zixibacteria bacterium]|nr:response regulator transcription factor [candidate division Zixibacteria bacterium]
MAKNILIVEDEEHIAEGLKINLEADGYTTDIAGDGLEALEKWRSGSFDLILLDIMLPEMDGLEVCKNIRDESGRIPILFLTARDAEDDRVAGLLAGGDDYITKPFSLKELMLRISAIFRRQSWYDENRLQVDRFEFDNYWVDFKTFTASGQNGPVELSQKECMIIKLLAEHSDEVVTRDMILDAVWGYDVYPSNRTVDNFIVRLRKIFEPDSSKPKYLHTVWGAGYKFTPAGSDDE